MLTMRTAATLCILFGLCASCLGYELTPPKLAPDVALLGLLLCFAYISAEAVELARRALRWLDKSRRKSRQRLKQS